MRTSSLVGLVLVAFALPARADLSLRHSTLVNGSFAVVGNAVVDCPTTSGCDNNTSVLVYVDKDKLPLSDLDNDGDDDTTGSSAATLVLPTNAVVVSATLYVGAFAYDKSGTATYGPGWVEATPTPTDFSVLFTPPGGTAYATVVPLDVRVVENADGYQARYDVTSLVTQAGQAWVANPRISPASHSYHRTSWWTLVVVYADGGPTKLINLYDGVIRCSNNTTVNTLGGFATPATGTVSARFSSWCEDGHASIAGESITIGTKALSNAQNSANNIGNSSVSDPSGPITRDPMAFRVSESVDIDSFDATGAFTNSQTTATVTFKCGAAEGVYYHGAVLAFDVLAPTVSVTKSVTPSGPVLPDTELEYTLTVNVTGADNAAGVSIRDVIPTGSTYVDGSVVMIDGDAPGAKTDAAGDDEAELDGDRIVVRVGTGANANTGGTVEVGTSRTLKFRVRAGGAGTTITNTAEASFRAASGGNDAPQTSVTSNAISTTVAVADADLATLADLAVPDDLSALPDLATSPDLVTTVDGSGTETFVDMQPDGGAGKPKSGCDCNLHNTPVDDAKGAVFGGLLALALALRPQKRARL